MATRLFAPEEVCERWRNVVSVRTLANWGCDPKGKGPPYKKFGDQLR